MTEIVLSIVIRFLLRATTEAGFEPVIASDAYEACQEVNAASRRLTGSIDGELTDEVTARKLSRIGSVPSDRRNSARITQGSSLR